jgi:hypothetical protein
MHERIACHRAAFGQESGTGDVDDFLVPQRNKVLGRLVDGGRGVDDRALHTGHVAVDGDQRDVGGDRGQRPVGHPDAFV